MRLARGRGGPLLLPPISSPRVSSVIGLGKLPSDRTIGVSRSPTWLPEFLFHPFLTWKPSSAAMSFSVLRNARVGWSLSEHSEPVPPR